MSPARGESLTAAVADAVDALAFERFVDSFLAQSSRSQLALIPVAAFVAIVWHQALGGPWPWVWAGVCALFALWRHGYTDRVVRGGSDRDSTRRIAALLLIGGALQSIPLLKFHELGDVGRGALTLILVTLATVSVITTSGFRSVFMAYSVPMLIPLALAWLIEGAVARQWAPAGLGGTLLIFQGFLFSVGRHANAVFMEGCAYRFGEQQLNRELTEALSRADEANRAKTQFLAAASHDLRQPIHSMNVLVAALSLKPLDEPTREIVGLLDSVNQALSRQLDTLLDISKLDAGVIRADPSSCRLDVLVRTHHAAIEQLASQKGLTLELDVESPVWVTTDPALLSRALSNLTDNAMKYTPRGGRVRLTLHQVGEDAVIRVSDTGIGIAAAEQARVFREFYQVSNVERDRSKGLGLGLSIVERLCRLLAVRVDLTSEVGRGTTVSLAMRHERAPEPVAAEPAADEAPPLNLRVLVVDDEAVIRRSMKLLLEGLGCAVWLADGESQAHATAAEQPLDLVMSDLRLRAGESGLAAIRRVQQCQPDVAAVLITGDTAPDRIREAEAAGVPLLFKPVSLDGLVDVMRRLPVA